MYLERCSFEMENIDYCYYRRAKWLKDTAVKFNIYASNEVLSLLEKLRWRRHRWGIMYLRLWELLLMTKQRTIF